MSTKIFEIENSDGMENVLDFTQFYGGNNRKTCIQLTQGFAGPVQGHDIPGYIQLTPKSALKTIVYLVEWLKLLAKDKEKKLTKEMEENKELKNTVFKDIRDMSNFIANFEVLELPVKFLE